MVKRKESSFTAWEFSEDELTLAVSLTDLQVKFIQNERAEVAERKLTLAFGDSDPTMVIREMEYLRGQLAAFDYLLTMHAAAAAHLQQLMLDTAAAQSMQ